LARTLHIEVDLLGNERKAYFSSIAGGNFKFEIVMNIARNERESKNTTITFI
jgi:hypothetical protein